MKNRYYVIVALVLLCAVLLSCNRPAIPTPATIPIETEVPNFGFDSFLMNNSVSSYFEKYCIGMANWVGEPGAISSSQSFDATINPTEIKVRVFRVVEISEKGYIVNFTEYESAVFKNGERLPFGDERNYAIKLAGDIVQGISEVDLTFSLEKNEQGYLASDFRCDLP